MAAMVTALSVSLFASAALGAVSPQALGSDLSIITHNDLYGNQTSRGAAAVVVDADCGYSTAVSKCAALGSALWNPDGVKQDLGFLKYLDYKKGKNGPFWVQGTAPGKCRAISTQGQLKDYPCDKSLSALCSNTAADTNKQISVTTKDSVITGTRSKDVFRFLGIKYATIPARFSHATYLAPAKNTSALEYGPQCFSTECKTCSEDCLSLNIYTPYLPNGKAKAEKKKAVLVWIYGGSFVSGSNRDLSYEGSSIAARGDVVNVAINYRLSTLGFLSLENTTLTGNYALTDASTALDWIRTHIEDFGGDKDRITVFGQSAGSALIRTLLTSKKSQNKFAGAIMQSTPQGGGAAPYSEYTSLAKASAQNQKILAEVGCSGTGEALVACLRKVDPRTLIGFRNATQSFTGTVASSPVLDNNFLTVKTLPLGPGAPKLPHNILAGVMHDDGSPFTTYPASSNVTQVLLGGGFNASAIQSSGLFPVPSNANNTLSLFNLTSRIATDSYFRCAAQSTAQLAAKNHVFKSFYEYEFDRAYQVTTWDPNNGACNAPKTPAHPFGDTSAPFYKCHSGEILSVFGNIIPMAGHARDEIDIPFSQFILDTWSAFARTGKPEPELDFLAARGYVNTTKFVMASPDWEEVGKTDKPVRILNDPPHDEAWRELKQCEVLGIGLDYYKDK